jgi:hypothetical protein
MMPGRRRVCAIDCERMQSIASALSERGSSGELSYRGRQGTPVAPSRDLPPSRVIGTDPAMLAAIGTGAAIARRVRSGPWQPDPRLLPIPPSRRFPSSELNRRVFRNVMAMRPLRTTSAARRRPPVPRQAGGDDLRRPEPSIASVFAWRAGTGGPSRCRDPTPARLRLGCASCRILPRSAHPKLRSSRPTQNLNEIAL